MASFLYFDRKKERKKGSVGGWGEYKPYLFSLHRSFSRSILVQLLSLFLSHLFEMLTTANRHRLVRAVTFDPIISVKACRKRLLSEHSIESVCNSEENDAMKKSKRLAGE